MQSPVSSSAASDMPHTSTTPPPAATVTPPPPPPRPSQLPPSLVRNPPGDKRATNETGVSAQVVPFKKKKSRAKKGEAKEGGATATKGPKKPCKCGQSDHQLTSFSGCPLNKKNNGKVRTEPDGGAIEPSPKRQKTSPVEAAASQGNIIVLDAPEQQELRVRDRAQQFQRSELLPNKPEILSQMMSF